MSLCEHCYKKMPVGLEGSQRAKQHTQKEGGMYRWILA